MASRDEEPGPKRLKLDEENGECLCLLCSPAGLWWVGQGNAESGECLCLFYIPADWRGPVTDQSAKKYEGPPM